MAENKANISSAHRAAHASLESALGSYHAHINQLTVQEAEIRQKKAIIRLAASSELASVKDLKLSADALAQRVAFCW